MRKRKCHHPENKLRRFKWYESGDFYYYKIICKCGFNCGGWSPKEAEKKLKEGRDEN